MLYAWISLCRSHTLFLSPFYSTFKQTSTNVSLQHLFSLYLMFFFLFHLIPLYCFVSSLFFSFIYFFPLPSYSSFQHTSSTVSIRGRESPSWFAFILFTFFF